MEDKNNLNMTTHGEIFMVPFPGQGHIFPCIELCKRISALNFKTTLILSSNLIASVPSAVRDNPLVEIAEIPDAPPAPPPPEAGGFRPGPGFDPFFHLRQHMGQAVQEYLSARPDVPVKPVCAVIDVMMSGIKDLFAKFNIPTVSFSTSGAVSAAMECATWRAHVGDMKPGETRSLPGLPDDMAITYYEINRRPHGGPPHGLAGPGGPPLGPGGPDMPPSGPGGPDMPPSGPDGGDAPPGGKKFGPPIPGGQPPWWDEVGGSIALLINTCDDLEHPFIDYVSKQIGKPAWGVGPLLPVQYWNSSCSILHDREVRPSRKSNHTEDQVIQWLDSKPRGSVIYVSFGSEVGPTLEEHGKLADALAESKHPFIWVIQPGAGKSGPPHSGSGDEGYYPRDLESKVGARGLIIQGWAPQLMILSHPSTGGFLSHCGWNSTVEAIGRKVPILAWPIRGDQLYNAKMVVSHFGIGYMVTDGLGLKKEDIVKGIDRLMCDDEVHQRAAALGNKFESGFPASSLTALDNFRDFILSKSIE